MAAVRMQRRHFACIAETVSSIDDQATRRQIAEKFARDLRATNSRFDRDRFLKACAYFEEVRA